MGETEHDHDDDGYTGPATLLADDQEIPVKVQLRGYFEPIDGRYHWYGRLAVDEAVTKVGEARKVTVTLRTPQGEAECSLSDPDPWGRYRVSGLGKPPFTLLDVAELVAD